MSLDHDLQNHPVTDEGRGALKNGVAMANSIPSNAMDNGEQLQRALDEQRTILWEAGAIVALAARALDPDSRDELPESTHRALRRAARIIDNAANGLELMVLERRAAELTVTSEETQVDHG